MSDELSLAKFEPHVDSAFRMPVNGSEQLLELTLVDVKRLSAYPGAPRQEPFSLLFRGPSNVDFPQGMYELMHEELGTVALFLCPMQPDQHGKYLEAVVN